MTTLSVVCAKILVALFLFNMILIFILVHFTKDKKKPRWELTKLGLEAQNQEKDVENPKPKPHLKSTY